MMEYIVKSGQSLLDVAIQVYGDVNLVHKLAYDNNIYIDDDVVAGTILKYEANVGKLDVVKKIVSKGYVISNYSQEQISPEPEPPTPTNPWDAYGELGEYIENSANSYIDLGFIPIADSGQTIFSFTDKTGGSGTYGAWGYIQRGNIDNRIAAGITADLTFAGIGSTITNIPREIGIRYIYKIDRKKLNFNVNNYDSAILLNPVSPIKCFFMHRNGGDDVPSGAGLVAEYDFYQELDDDGNFIIYLKPLNLTKQSITDAAGRVHNIGDWVFYDIITNTVPAHYGTFTGAMAIN